MVRKTTFFRTHSPLTFKLLEGVRWSGEAAPLPKQRGKEQSSKIG